MVTGSLVALTLRSLSKLFHGGRGALPESPLDGFLVARGLRRTAAKSRNKGDLKREI